jgi:ParB/RepB/Spo0J family partition protein
MGTQEATHGTSIIVQLQVASIKPSKTNRHYPKEAVDQMAKSIQTNGLLQPIVVRAVNGHHELIAGHGRWLAFQQLKLTTIPAIVLTCSEEEAQSAQIVENLQRTDLTPMEEATSLGHLRELIGKNATIEQVAAHVGKDAAHVAQRLKLLDLIPEAQKGLADGRLALGHALLIAPLTEPQQTAVLKQIIFEERTDPSNWEAKVRTTHSVKWLRAFIEREFMLSLGAAPFDVKDAKLNPKMGACPACPHNTANATSLFPDVQGATCTLPQCYFAKVRAAIDVKVEAITKADGKKPYRLGLGWSNENVGESKIPVDGYIASRDGLVAPGDECKSSRKAVLVWRGSRVEKEIKAKVGDVTTICADPKCGKHHRTESYGGERKAPLKGLAFVKHKEGNLAKSQPQRLRWAVFKDLAGRLLSGSKGTTDIFQPLMLIAARQASEHLYYDSMRDAAKALGYEKPATPKGSYGRTPWDGQIEKHFKGNAWAWLLAINAAEDIRSDQIKGSQLFTIAEAYKVDIAKLRAEIVKADKELIGGMTARAKAREAKPKAKVKQVAVPTRGRAGTCSYCKCTDDKPCSPPCSWVNKEETICSNPACVAKGVEAGVLKKKTKGSAA